MTEARGVARTRPRRALGRGTRGPAPAAGHRRQHREAITLSQRTLIRARGAVAVALVVVLLAVMLAAAGVAAAQAAPPQAGAT